MNNFTDYEQARDYSHTIPWKIGTCVSGERCWCRIIFPVEEIEWIETDIHPVNNHELIANHKLDAIVPDGSVHKIIAEHIVKVHNESLG